MKKILAAILAAFTLVMSASAQITITPIQPSRGENYLYANVVNGVTPVATINIPPATHGKVINGMSLNFTGTYFKDSYDTLDVCITEDGKVLWTGPVKYVEGEWSQINLNIHCAKTESRKLSLGIIRRSWFDQERELSLGVELDYSPGRPGYTSGYTYTVKFPAWSSGLYFSTQPVSSLSDETVKPGMHILGGFRLGTYSDNWSLPEQFEIINPTFRLYTSIGKDTDITGLMLQDETGQVIARKGEIIQRDGGSFIRFPGSIILSHGDVAVFLRGRVGATFKKGATVSVAFVPADQGMIQSSIDGGFTSSDTRAVMSRELTFGVPPVIIVPIDPEPIVTIPGGRG